MVGWWWKRKEERDEKHAFHSFLQQLRLSCWLRKQERRKCVFKCGLETTTRSWRKKMVFRALLFWHGEPPLKARHDFEFSFNASENNHNAPKARCDCAPCHCKMLAFPLWPSAHFPLEISSHRTAISQKQQCMGRHLETLDRQWTLYFVSGVEKFVLNEIFCFLSLLRNTFLCSNKSFCRGVSES